MTKLNTFIYFHLQWHGWTLSFTMARLNTFTRILLTSLNISFVGQEFLRAVYKKCEDNKELQEKSEEGFLYLTDRLKLDFFTIHLMGADPRCGELRSRCTLQKGKKLHALRGLMSISGLGASPFCQNPSKRGLNLWLAYLMRIAKYLFQESIHPVQRYWWTTRWMIINNFKKLNNDLIFKIHIFFHGQILFSSSGIGKLRGRSLMDFCWAPILFATIKKNVIKKKRFTTILAFIFFVHLCSSSTYLVIT